MVDIFGVSALCTDVLLVSVLQRFFIYTKNCVEKQVSKTEKSIYIHFSVFVEKQVSKTEKIIYIFFSVFGTCFSTQFFVCIYIFLFLVRIFPHCFLIL